MQPSRRRVGRRGGTPRLDGSVLRSVAQLVEHRSPKAAGPRGPAVFVLTPGRLGPPNTFRYIPDRQTLRQIGSASVGSTVRSCWPLSPHRNGFRCVIWAARSPRLTPHRSTADVLNGPRPSNVVPRRAQAHRRLERHADAVILSAAGARRSPDNGNNRRGDRLPFQPPACTHKRPWGRRS